MTNVELSEKLGNIIFSLETNFDTMVRRLENVPDLDVGRALMWVKN